MKLRSLLFVVPVIVALAVVLLIGGGVGKSKSHDHSHKQQAATGQLPPLIANGSENPAAIPDRIAYEILFTSITTTPQAGEAERKIAQGLARKTGLDNAKAELLRQIGDDFRNRISTFDRQATELKDRHWPKPSVAVMNQLNALQKQKEAVLDGMIYSLPGRLGAEEAQKLSQRIEEIKSKVRVYQEVPIEAYQHK